VSSGRDRVDERFARAIVEQVTGAKVVRTDDRNAPPGTVDGRLDYPGGRTAALEISTLGLPSQFELEARIGRLAGRLPMPGRWKWVLSVTNPDELPRLKAIYERAILACEAYRVVQVGELPRSVIDGDPDLGWLQDESTCRLFGIRLPEGAQDTSGYVDLGYYPATSGWLTGPDCIVAELNAALAVEPLSKRVAKLLSAAEDERHLFLRVASSGLAEPAFVRLILLSTTDEGVDPIRGEPDLPDPITDLWLVTGWGRRLIRWTLGRGWQYPAVR